MFFSLRHFLRCGLVWGIIILLKLFFDCVDLSNLSLALYIATPEWTQILYLSQLLRIQSLKNFPLERKISPNGFKFLINIEILGQERMM